MPPPPKRWKAAELAPRAETKRQAQSRIATLLHMISKHERKMAAIKLRIMKHNKEIRLLREQWDLPGEPE